jgi:hypothetical protein
VLGIADRVWTIGELMAMHSKKGRSYARPKNK